LKFVCFRFAGEPNKNVDDAEALVKEGCWAVVVMIHKQCKNNKEKLYFDRSLAKSLPKTLSMTHATN
jgi:hypothetical protein